MKTSITWLKELVDLQIPVEKLAQLIPLRVQGGIKELTDSYIEFDLKGYNRADLLSMRGVAYEVAAITDSKVNFTEIDQFIWTEKNLQDIETGVESNLCSVYCIAKIEGLRVEKSPKEWVKKLEGSGIRPVNNIADVTNLIMLEYGQPLHAFDADKVEGEKLIVRLASQGETLQTLDGKNRSLDNSDLLITDAQKPLGLAGVMGGKDSEVSNVTTTILLEAAIFDPVTIRRTANRHSLQSEASKRFQHGLTKKRLLQALDAAIRMYEQLGGKLTAISLTGDFKEEHKKVELTHKKVEELIGVKIPSEFIEKNLQRLNFNTIRTSTPGLKVQNMAWEVKIPYWRLDINIEEDLVEEVARMYGYEKIPPKELGGKLPERIDQSLFELIDKLKEGLVDLGLTEVQTYSFYSTKVLEALDFSKGQLDQKLIRIANPISSETEFMRQNIWPNLIEVVGKNLRQGFSDIAVFEIGKVYETQKNDLPKESFTLAIALMNCSENPTQELLSIFQGVKLPHLQGVQLKIGEWGPFFHPTRSVNVEVNKKIIGYLAEVHPKVLHKYGIEKRVAVIEMNYPAAELAGYPLESSSVNHSSSQ